MSTGCILDISVMLSVYLNSDNTNICPSTHPQRIEICKGHIIMKNVTKTVQQSFDYIP